MNILDKYCEWINRRYGIEKPYALTWGGWDEWHDQNKRDHPIAYWMSETMPEHLRNAWHRIANPIKDLRYAIRLRLFDRYHVIKTGLKPGYHEFDERCLHGMFNMLVDYVEVQLAWKSSVFDETERKKLPWWSRGWTRFKSARSAELGIKHLKWESTLDSDTLPAGDRSDYQAKRAREILDLYHWWKVVRPLRQDPMDQSGWTAWCDDKRQRNINLLSNKGITAEEKQQEHEILDRMHAIEEAFDDEDTTQLIRLIKIRKGLWT